MTSAQAVFDVDCVFGGKPSAPSFTVSLPIESYPVTAGRWVPSSDANSPLAYQGAAAVPNLCRGGLLRLAPSATFSAEIGV